jgi:hypothetical protein
MRKGEHQDGRAPEGRAPEGRAPQGALANTVTTGWSFSALIFFVDDLAVFALAGGQPNINTETVSRNPLGPLQGLGSSVPVPY